MLKYGKYKIKALKNSNSNCFYTLMNYSEMHDYNIRCNYTLLQI